MEWLIYLDYFLRLFAHAVAWSLAAALVGGFSWSLWWKHHEARERRRVAQARAWLAARLPGLNR